MIKLFYGPMFAGKTHAAVTAALEAAGGDASLILGLRPKKDTRLPLDEIRARTGVSIPCRRLSRVPLRPSKPIVVLDEFQFFGLEAPRRVLEWHKAGRMVFIAGLNYDSRGQEWASVAFLRRQAECQAVQIHGTCARCGAPSVYTRRTAKANKRALIGDAESYEPLCPSCWREATEKPIRSWNPHKRSKVKAETVRRKCLRCGAMFDAPGRFIRLCGRCHDYMREHNL